MLSCRKSIGECKSKQEEDKILQHEVSVLKQRFTESLSPKKAKEAIVRMMYAEMLGHDASFAHIHAINMTQQTNLVSKRIGPLLECTANATFSASLPRFAATSLQAVCHPEISGSGVVSSCVAVPLVKLIDAVFRPGYLASALCLHPHHELVTLLVNTMRRDLSSSNHVEVCASLITFPKLVNLETLPALQPSVVALLDHTHEVVRKKAVMVARHRLQSRPHSSIWLFSLSVALSPGWLC